MSSGDQGRPAKTDPARISSRYSDEAATITVGHHRDLLVVVGLLCLVTLTVGPYYPRSVTAGGDIDASSAPALRTGIDPNRAQWYEIAQLPGLGETVAKRWVAHRQQHGGDRPAYLRPYDLTRIRGIGDRTLQRIKPFLRFSDPPAR